jgi:hypothetical protein
MTIFPGSTMDDDQLRLIFKKDDDFLFLSQKKFSP